MSKSSHGRSHDMRKSLTSLFLLASQNISVCQVYLIFKMMVAGIPKDLRIVVIPWRLVQKEGCCWAIKFLLSLLLFFFLIAFRISAKSVVRHAYFKELRLVQVWWPFLWLVDVLQSCWVSCIFLAMACTVVEYWALLCEKNNTHQPVWNEEGKEGILYFSHNSG